MNKFKIMPLVSLAVERIDPVLLENVKDVLHAYIENVAQANPPNLL